MSMPPLANRSRPSLWFPQLSVRQISFCINKSCRLTSPLKHNLLMCSWLGSTYSLLSNLYSGYTSRVHLIFVVTCMYRQYLGQVFTRGCWELIYESEYLFSSQTFHNPPSLRINFVLLKRNVSTLRCTNSHSSKCHMLQSLLLLPFRNIWLLTSIGRKQPNWIPQKTNYWNVHELCTSKKEELPFFTSRCRRFVGPYLLSPQWIGVRHCGRTSGTTWRAFESFVTPWRRLYLATTTTHP